MLVCLSISRDSCGRGARRPLEIKSRTTPMLSVVLTDLGRPKDLYKYSIQIPYPLFTSYHIM